jgi:hypothetical protein
MCRWIKIIGCCLGLATFMAEPLQAQRFAEGMGLSMQGSEAPEEESEIETDRDSFTPSTRVAEVGTWIVESSYSFIDNRRVFDTHSLPELLLRRGINDWMELRFGYNYEVGGAGNPISGNIPSDLGDEPELEEEARLLYGTKIYTTSQSGWVPESSILLHGYTPTFGKETATTFAAAYVFGWKLPNRMIWDSGMRFATSKFEEDEFGVWSPSTVLKMSIGEKWKAHVEYFGVFTQGRETESAQHFFSPGAHYLLTKNLEVGLRVGWGLNDQAPDFFSNIGVGWQF